MTYMVIYIDVQPSSATEAIALIKRYRKDCSVEEGNLWVEALQETTRQNRFVLVESWKDESSVQAHEAAEHTAQFRQLAPRTNHFTVFAAWSDEKAFASHELKLHTRQFREALGPMLGAPYDERLYQHLT